MGGLVSAELGRYVCGIHTPDPEHLVSGRLTSNQFNISTRAAEELGEEPHHSVVRCCVHGRSGHGHLELAAMDPANAIHRGAGLHLDGERHAVGMRTNEGWQGSVRRHGCATV